MAKTKIGGIIQNTQLAAVRVSGIADRPGVAAAVLTALGQNGISAQFIVQCIDLASQDHIVVCVDRDRADLAFELVQGAAQMLQARHVDLIREVSLISIFGPDFRERPGIAGAMFSALAQRGINIFAISTSISTVSCVINRQDTESALEAISDTFELP
ncbi:MAG: ACT domain-containing protein [Anaerolineae bacterium]|nr:ACT domain-containing protein [Anaerolineae bacterium]